MSDEHLFDLTRPARRGRIRRGLDDDVKHARDRGDSLPAAGVASLRAMADQLDALDRILRTNDKPYDRVPLATLQRQFDETYSAVLGSAHATDPFDRLVAELAAAEAPHPQGPPLPD